MPVPLIFGGELGGFVEERVKRISIERLPFQNYRVNFLGVLDVIQRVGVEQDQVGALAGGDAAPARCCGLVNSGGY